MSVFALFLLSSLGFAVTARAQSCSKPAGRNNMHLKDEYIVKDTFEDGSTVAFACDIGYTSTGRSGSIKCAAGLWTPVELTCERKNCGAFAEVLNGEVNYPMGSQFGDKAIVTCNRGYRLVGKNEILCGDEGWLGRVPECEVLRCPQPGGIANGGFSPQKEEYSYGDTVKYSCNNGYTRNGSNELTCGTNEKFEPSPPSCIWVQCKDPEIKNAKQIDGSRPPYGHQATVIYACENGYSMRGQSNLVCNMSSQWAPRLPQCINNGNAVVGGLIGGLAVSITVLLVQNYWM
ncbi:membrane cofactor protein-like isoform 2-T2 [Fundulus diaphanus]